MREHVILTFQVFCTFKTRP